MMTYTSYFPFLDGLGGCEGQGEEGWDDELHFEEVGFVGLGL
jgi:hypothetical protein